MEKIVKRRKKKNDDNVIAPRAKGVRRQELILEIVKTDRTFEKLGSAAGWIGRCLHCNTSIHVGDTGQSHATIEHIVPTCAGGSGSDMLNLALACSRCNNEKGIRHDPKYPSDPKAVSVVNNLLDKRKKRWRGEATIDQ